MAEPKLEYFLERMAQPERQAFLDLLLESKKKIDQLLGRLLQLVIQGEKDKEVIYQVLYPGKAFSVGSLRNLRTKLLSKLLDFLAHETFEDSPEKGLMVAKAMNRIHANRYFSSTVDGFIKEEQSKGLSLDQADLHNRIQAESLVHEKSVKGRKELPLESLIEGTEEAFIARILYYALAHHEAKGMYQSMGEDPPLKLWPTIKLGLENGEWQGSILVQLYYSLVKLVYEPETRGHLGRSRSLLTAYGSQISREEVQQMYTVVLNHCIRRCNQGNDTFLHEIFHLYQEMLERKLMVNDGSMSAWHFKSIVGNAVRIQEYEWAKEFIGQYSKYLPHQFRDNLLNYSYGMIAFEEGNWKQAEWRMNKVLEEYEDPFFGLDARSWLLRIYYETQNDTGMDSLTNSFRLFLRRHRHLNPKRLRNYREFIRFFRRLVAIPPGNTQRAIKLRVEIMASPHHASRNWLLQKLDAHLQKTDSGIPESVPDQLN